MKKLAVCGDRKASIDRRCELFIRGGIAHGKIGEQSRLWMGMIMNGGDDERARVKVKRRRLFLTEVASFL
ncbi:hypothetical protein [Bartonella apis]|uniref:hypothetical protein n=1 Tax=Bartonella apis TaxID=1686310 RepID=UPI00096A6924|nr:hypothetical protein [Bartonella apis]